MKTTRDEIKELTDQQLHDRIRTLAIKRREALRDQHALIIECHQLGLIESVEDFHDTDECPACQAD